MSKLLWTCTKHGFGLPETAEQAILLDFTDLGLDLAELWIDHVHPFCLVESSRVEQVYVGP